MAHKGSGGLFLRLIDQLSNHRRNRLALFVCKFIARAHCDNRALPPPPLERKPDLAIILWTVSEGAMRSRCVYIATLFGALIAPAMVVASERVDICAQYSATGDTYHVTAVSTNGSELNEATNTLNYDSLSSYIVISWPDD